MNVIDRERRMKVLLLMMKMTGSRSLLGLLANPKKTLSDIWLQWLQWGVTFSQVVWLIGC